MLKQLYRRFFPPEEITLSEARSRVQSLLDKSPADVTTTVRLPGTSPIVTVKPLYQPYQPPTRQQIVDKLDRLRLEAERMDEKENGREELCAALDACYRLVTEGRLTLVRAIREEKEAIGL